MMKLCGWSCVLEKTSIYIGPLVDDEGHALSYTVTGLPEGIDVVYVEVAADGREPGAYLQGYIAYSNVASNAPPVDFHVIMTVTKEGDGNSFQSDSFTWTIRDTSRLGSISDQVSREGEFIFWIPPVARTEGETLVIHYSGLPLGLEYFANSGLVYGYVSYANIASNGHARSLEVTIFVNDGTGMESKTFQWQVEDTNRIPVLPDVSISEGDYINVKINAEDATRASLTYAADKLPQGLRIDSATGRITGTVSYRNVGPREGVREFIINIRVTDGESEDMRTVTWTVQDKDWWSAPPNLTNLEGEEVCFELCAPSVSAGWDNTVRLCACKGRALFLVVLVIKDAADAVNRMRGRALSLVLLASPKIQIIRQDRYHARALRPAELRFGPRRRFTDVMCYHVRALGPAELPSKLAISQVGGHLPKLEEAQVTNFVPITPSTSPACSKTWGGTGKPCVFQVPEIERAIRRNRYHATPCVQRSPVKAWNKTLRDAVGLEVRGWFSGAGGRRRHSWRCGLGSGPRVPAAGW
jgi:hypothetical protein